MDVYVLLRRITPLCGLDLTDKTDEKKFDLGDITSKEFMPEMWTVNDVNRMKEANVDIIIGYVHFDSDMKCTNPDCDAYCKIDMKLRTAVPLVKDTEYAGSGKVTVTYEVIPRKLSIDEFFEMMEEDGRILLWNIETDEQNIMIID